MSSTNNWQRSRSAALLVAVAMVVAVMAVVLPIAPIRQANAQDLTVEQVNDRLGTGVNLGNALEGPREGVWGLTLREDFFPAIAQAGFGHVRVPIRFSAYAAESPPYAIPDGIDPSVPNADNLWDRIDWVIDNAERNGLYVIIDFHHYDELFDDVAGERTRYLAIWRQIAERYADAGPLVLFELLNEPHGQFNEDPTLLTPLLRDALSIVRATNPTRPVLVGPPFWNSIDALDSLVLPNDPNLIVSVHFYEPFDFTHQGAEWIDPVPPAPATFEPNRLGFGEGWQNWSWDSSINVDGGSFTVTFDRQWAGLGFGRPSLVSPQSLRFVGSGDAELLIRCNSEDDVDVDVTRVVTTDTARTFNVDMASCPTNTESVNFMMASGQFDAVSFSEIELCETDGTCTRMISNGRQAIQDALAAAAAWGENNNRPINVGEFGAFSAGGVADENERAEWTEIVRTASEANGLSRTYWEFGAGFGVFDPDTNTWVEPLLAALGVEPPAACNGSLTNGPTDLAGYTALAPSRVLDSRNSTAGDFATPWSANESRDVRLAGIGDVPVGASAVAVNVTTVAPNGRGESMAPVSWLEVGPAGASASGTASHNFGTAAVTTELVNDLLIVAVNERGFASIKNEAGDVDLVMDVVGYFREGAGACYVPVDNQRILDSRGGAQNVGPFASPWGAGQSREVTVTGVGGVPATNVEAVMLHVTSANPTAALSWLTINPAGEASTSATAALNFGTGVFTTEIVNDVVIAKVGANGAIDIENARGSVDVIIDVAGYFTTDPAASGFVAQVPDRVLDSRNSTEGAFNTPWGPGQTRTLDFDAIGCSVDAVAMHVTTVSPSAPVSWLTFSAGGVAPSTTAVHVFGTDAATSQIGNDLVIAKVNRNNEVDIRNENGRVHLVVDLVGYFTDSNSCN